MSSFALDGHELAFVEGQTILEAARAAGVDIPHLCAHPDLPPHGSCRVCTVRCDGHLVASCTTPARIGMRVESEVDEVRSLRRSLVQMLFVEGNHFCPACERSGTCRLQSVAYQLGVDGAGFEHLHPQRRVDASHPDVMLDFNRCILCSLCVRASRDLDGKSVFGFAGRGARTQLVVNAASGHLADTDLSMNDRAMGVCPVGALLVKRTGFLHPIVGVAAQSDASGSEQR